MRQYANPELEKLLLSKGCVPDDKHFDFLDCIRRENAIKIFGEEGYTYSRAVIIDNGYENGADTYAIEDTQYEWQYQTHHLIDLYQSGGDWQTYLISHLKNI